MTRKRTLPSTPKFKHANDMGMDQLGDQLGFLTELVNVVLSRQVCIEYLDCCECGERAMLGEIDVGKPPGAQEPNQTIVPQVLPAAISHRAYSFYRCLHPHIRTRWRLLQFCVPVK